MLALVVLGLLQGQSLFREVVPRPTGANGYEDYLRAADTVQDREFRRLVRWLPGEGKRLREEYEAQQRNPSSVEEGDEIKLEHVLRAEEEDRWTQLEVWRKVVSRWGRAWPHVRVGNSKPVFDPRQRIGLDTSFRELMSFMDLARLCVAMAKVELADGNGRLAANTYLEGLLFTARIGGGVLIQRLSAIAAFQIVAAGIEVDLPRLPERFSSELATVVEQALDLASLRKSIETDGRSLIASVPEILRDPELLVLLDLGQESSLFDQKLESLRNRIKGSSAATRDTLGRRVAESLEERKRRRVALLNLPESRWLAAEKELDVQSGDPDADLIAKYLDGVSGLETDLVYRTRLRILRALALVHVFHLRHERWPNPLEEAVPQALRSDPLAEGELEFQWADGKPQVTSRGGGGIGPIQLRTRVGKPAESSPPP